MSDRTGTNAQPRTWPPVRVLVGFDGSEGSRDALALAGALARGGATLLLVNVIPPAVPMPIRPRLLAGEEPPQSRDFFATASAVVENHEIETRNYAGRSAAQVLTDIAERERTDVVVVGSPSRSVLGRALLGSTARGLMYGAAAPAVVAPLGYADQEHAPPQPIAVAYDGTPEAKAALEYAQAAAQAGDGSLRVLTVATRSTTPAGMLGYEPPMPKSPTEVLAEGVAAVGNGIAVEGRKLVGGSIPAAIVEDCGEEVDLIVVGSRGYGAFSRVMIGSVADGLIHQAACPVLVVPRPGRDESEVAITAD